MTHIPDYPDLPVRDVINRLFDDVEPPHRPGMAQVSISQRASTARRRGYAVAGAAVSVLAVTAGAVAVVGRGGGDWSLHPDPGTSAAAAAYEDSAPTYSDKLREIDSKLPGLLTPLLPAGMTVRADPGQSAVSGTTGDVSLMFTLRAGGIDSGVRIDSDDTGYERAFSQDPVTAPVPVKGGTFRVRTLSSDGGQGPVFSTWFEYKPTDTSKAPIRIVIQGNGASTAAPLDTEAFKKLVDAPGFATLATLLDPSTPASFDAVRQRRQIEARMDAAAAGVLPAGFRLKLNPAVPGALELVGPHGVNTFTWYVQPGPTPCKPTTLCFSAELDGKFPHVGPDGKARLGTYVYTPAGAEAPTVYVTVRSKPTLGVNHDPMTIGKADSEPAPQGPGLTPQQAMAIMRAPGVVRAITEVQKATTS